MLLQIENLKKNQIQRKMQKARTLEIEKKSIWAN